MTTAMVSLIAPTTDRESLARAVVCLQDAKQKIRIYLSLFDDSDDPVVEPSVLRHQVESIIPPLTVASDEMFNMDLSGPIGSACFGRLLSNLYDVIATLYVVSSMLERGTYPDNRGITTCPVQGPLLLVDREMSSLLKRLARIEANLPKTSTSKRQSEATREQAVHS